MKDVILNGGAGQDWGDEACGGGQHACSAASGAGEGSREGFFAVVHDGDGVHDEVQIGVASRAPRLRAAGLVGVPGDVSA